MILYTLYKQPSYGTNQTDLQMEITLVWFSETKKLWWPFWWRKMNSNFRKKRPDYTWWCTSLQLQVCRWLWLPRWRSAVFFIKVIRIHPVLTLFSRNSTFECDGNEISPLGAYTFTLEVPGGMKLPLAIVTSHVKVWRIVLMCAC